jgi:hypothetical protein
VVTINKKGKRELHFEKRIKTAVCFRTRGYPDREETKAQEVAHEEEGGYASPPGTAIPPGSSPATKGSISENSTGSGRDGRRR